MSENTAKIDIISPISIGNDTENISEAVECMVWQKENYGINKFMISTPSKGYRSIGYPKREQFLESARCVRRIRIKAEPHGIEVGWWMILTLKSGLFSNDSAAVRITGEKHPFANCPLCEEFAQRFAADAALVADIAKPAFIITEDDFSLDAAKGCFCDRHLKAFGEKMGRYYSREELSCIFADSSKESLEILKKWRESAKESLVGFAKRLRREIDKKNAGIPMGFMQPGGCDRDGDSTEEMARALAGIHTPFARLYGTYYGGNFCSKNIPEIIYHAVYSKQHIGENFRFYHESDTFPSTRYFTSGAQMRAVMAAAYSYGFDGSTFQTAQSNDDPTEEKAYGRMLKREQKRFDEIKNITNKCKNTGVLIGYDPFYNTVDKSVSKKMPLWALPVGRFGVPYVADDSDTVFVDKRQVKYADDSEIRELLSKNVFLEGDAAYELCQRGYSRLLGVMVGDDVIKDSALASDLGAREVITEEFKCSKGIKMPAANAFSPTGNGVQRKIEITDPKCRIVTELKNVKMEAVCPAMTCFENALGGNVCVMGMTLDKNGSQSLYNYRRMKLIQHVLSRFSDKYATVKDAPDVFVIQNDAKDKSPELLGMLTVINLGEDALDEVNLGLPKDWSGAKVSIMDENGTWQRVETTESCDGITVKTPVDHLAPVYLLFERKR